jgi:hypothetical protein
MEWMVPAPAIRSRVAWQRYVRRSQPSRLRPFQYVRPHVCFKRRMRGRATFGTPRLEFVALGVRVAHILLPCLEKFSSSLIIPNIHNMTIANLPQLPLVCLKTADSKDTQQVVRGKPTIIGTFPWSAAVRYSNVVVMCSFFMPTVPHHAHCVVSIYPFRLLDYKMYSMPRRTR